MGQESQAKRSRNKSDPVGRCPLCGKQRYYTKHAAKVFARRVFPGELFSYYTCEGFWHFGHLPPFVRDGSTPRSALGGGR